MTNEELLDYISSWIKENQYIDYWEDLSIYLEDFNDFLNNLKEKIKEDKDVQYK